MYLTAGKHSASVSFPEKWIGVTIFGNLSDLFGFILKYIDLKNKDLYLNELGGNVTYIYMYFLIGTKVST